MIPNGQVTTGLLRMATFSLIIAERLLFLLLLKLFLTSEQSSRGISCQIFNAPSCSTPCKRFKSILENDWKVIYFCCSVWPYLSSFLLFHLLWLLTLQKTVFNFHNMIVYIVLRPVEAMKRILCILNFVLVVKGSKTFVKTFSFHP